MSCHQENRPHPRKKDVTEDFSPTEDVNVLVWLDNCTPPFRRHKQCNINREKHKVENDCAAPYQSADNLAKQLSSWIRKASPRTKAGLVITLMAVNTSAIAKVKIKMLYAFFSSFLSLANIKMVNELPEIANMQMIMWHARIIGFIPPFSLLGNGFGCVIAFDELFKEEFIVPFVLEAYGFCLTFSFVVLY